ncbi:hypothetical protein ISS04_02730 [Candidatus Woesearchaeota archaeon]|nr:hypothetical protein [Candidatus Woesearchaeota archaeon]
MVNTTVAKRTYYNEYLEKRITEYVLISGRTPYVFSQSMGYFSKYVASIFKKGYPNYGSSLSAFNRDGYVYLGFDEDEKRDLEHRVMNIRKNKQRK